MEHLIFDIIVTPEVLHLRFYSMYLTPVQQAYSCPSEIRFC